MDTVINILRIFLLVLDCFAALTLVLFLLIGFLKGWRKNIINLLSFAIPFILLLILLNPIASAFTKINLFNNGTLEEIIINGVKENVNKGQELSNESINICKALAFSTYRLIIYESGIWICLIFSLINRLILKRIFKGFLESEKNTGVSLKSKLLGMGISTIRYIFFFFIFIFPIIGIINIADVGIRDVAKAEEMYNSESENSEIDYNKISNTLNKSVLYKFAKVGVGEEEITLPAKYLGLIYSVKANGVTTNIISEYGHIRPSIPIILKLALTTDTKNKIIKIDISEQEAETLSRHIKSCTVIKLIAPLIKDVAITNYSEGLNDDTKDIIEKLKDIDVIKEIDIFTDALVIITNNIRNVEIDTEHVYKILLNKQLPDMVDQVVNKLLESDITNYILIPKINESIQEIFKGNPLKDIFSEDSIKKCFSTDIKALLLLYQELSEKANLSGVIFEEQKFDLSNKEVIEALCDSISEVFNLSIVKGNEKLLISYVLDLLKQPNLTYDSLFKNVTPNWSVEVDNLAAVLKEILYIYDQYIKDQEPSFKLLVTKDENGIYIIIPTIEKLSNSELFRTVGINYFKENFNKLLGDTTNEELKEAFNFENLRSLTNEEFKNEIERLLNIFDTLIQMKVLFAEEGEEPILSEEYIKQVVTLIFDSVLIKGNEKQIVSYILNMTGLNDALKTFDLQLNLNDVNWEIESDNLIDVINAILAFGDLKNINFEQIMNDRTEENKNRVSALFKALGKSQIFDDASYKMIEKMVSQIDGTYKVEFSDEEKQEIKKHGWENEINNLFEVVDLCKTYLNDAESYKTVEGSTVTNIMLKASESVISSKIVGIILNDMLGENNLNIMPKNEDGTPKYDFSDPATLKETANDIGTLIDISKNVDKYINSEDDTNKDNAVKAIVDGLNLFSDSEFTKDVVGKYTNISDAETESLDLKNESIIIQDVYDEYSKNPSDFSIENHKELAEEVNNSSVAKSILTMLGII